MAKRTNVILPEATVRTLDRLARPGQRSRFIDRAVQHYVTTGSPGGLQEGLKKAALRDRALDLDIGRAAERRAAGPETEKTGPGLVLQSAGSCRYGGGQMGGVRLTTAGVGLS